MKSAILIDENDTDIKYLESLLHTYCPGIAVLAAAGDADSGHAAIQAFKPDIVFLGAELNDRRSFSMVQEFKDPCFEVIFTSTCSEYAMEAFRLQALDYLLKPIGINELQAAVYKAEQRIALKQANTLLQELMDGSDKNNNEGKIALPVLEGYKFVRPGDIVYCKASGSYTLLFFADGRSDLVSIRLGACEQLLPAPAFFRVHYSYIVNLSYVDQYVKGRGGYLMLHNGGAIDVAASRKEKFLEVIANQWRDNRR